MLLLQLFDGKDGRPKYPRRWVILPPFLWRGDDCGSCWPVMIQYLMRSEEVSSHGYQANICTNHTFVPVELWFRSLKFLIRKMDVKFFFGILSQCHVFFLS
jgi:hypothetical protein